MFEKNPASSRIRTRDPVIRNFCLDILNSGPIQRVGREKRRWVVEDVDSSIYETGPVTSILKVHLISMRLFMCPLFSENRKSIPFLVVKKLFKKYDPLDFEFCVVLMFCENDRNSN